jgi:hypothetical protein
MNVNATSGRRIDNVACTVDIAHTAEELYAHVSLHGVEVAPGDVVQIHVSPAPVDYGLRIACAGRATVVRAGWLRRMWTRTCGYFQLTALYEVSFSPARLDVATRFAPRGPHPSPSPKARGVYFALRAISRRKLA